MGQTEFIIIKMGVYSGEQYFGATARNEKLLRTVQPPIRNRHYTVRQTKRLVCIQFLLTTVLKYI